MDFAHFGAFLSKKKLQENRLQKGILLELNFVYDRSLKVIKTTQGKYQQA